MKQVDKVSIGGYAFTMESEAAHAARIYLEQLGDYYKSSEVMEGIEERMAELLLEKTPSEGVVDLATVNGIIEILGRPERIEAEEPKKEDVMLLPLKIEEETMNQDIQVASRIWKQGDRFPLRASRGTQLCLHFEFKTSNFWNRKIIIFYCFKPLSLW